MQTLGEIFKKERERQNKSIKEIANILKVSARYLIAIEEDKLDEIDVADIYKKGIIRNYARYLGIDENEAISLYETQYQKPIIQEIKKVERKQKSFVYLIYGIVFVIIIISFYLIYKSSKSVPPEVPKTFTYTYTYTYNETYTEQEKETYTASQVEVLTPTIKVKAYDRCWVRVSYDNKVVFEGTLKSGDEFTWTYPYLEFYVGNAGGIEIFYNDKSIGILGKKGEVKKVKVP
ncbi:MAG: transcriptional regulator [Dictyoglomus sp. NZ13-RE01]|nr:MAG: transcriptional regulator [Dictyoglomus sp. NZ13-RE01]